MSGVPIALLRRLENLLGHPTRPSTIVTTIRDTGDSSWQELLMVLLAFSAVISVVQHFVAELIQRRIFVRVVLDVAERLPRVQAQAFDRHHGPELVNRVFDVVMVQKVGSLLLLEGTTVLLQTTVGLVVLSFYHPLMWAFSRLLIDVNIRETQAADAARALIFAQAAYFRALARYQAASASIGP